MRPEDLETILKVLERWKERYIPVWDEGILNIGRISSIQWEIIQGYYDTRRTQTKLQNEESHIA